MAQRESVSTGGTAVGSAMISSSRKQPPGGRRLRTERDSDAALAPRGRGGYPLCAAGGRFPGMAVGWRTLPADSARFEGDIRLTPPIERTLTVVDAEGRPVEGAKVVAYSKRRTGCPGSLLLRTIWNCGRTMVPTWPSPEWTGGRPSNNCRRRKARSSPQSRDLRRAYAFREQETIRLTSPPRFPAP